MLTDALWAPDSPSPPIDRHKQSVLVVEMPVRAFEVAESMHSYMLTCGLHTLVTAATVSLHTIEVRHESCSMPCHEYCK